MVKTFTEINMIFNDSYNNYRCDQYLTEAGKKAKNTGDCWCNSNGCKFYSKNVINGYGCLLCQAKEILEKMAMIEQEND